MKSRYQRRLLGLGGSKDTECGVPQIGLAVSESLSDACGASESRDGQRRHIVICGSIRAQQAEEQEHAISLLLQGATDRDQ